MVVAVAGAARAAYLPEVAALPDFRAPAVDAAYHDWWARGIATGEWPLPGGQIVAEHPRVEEHAWFRPPGYPHALAAVYALGGDDPTTVRVVQLALGAISCGLCAVLGALAHSRAVGLLAGLLAAGSWTSVYYDAELQPPVVVTALVLLALLAALLASRCSRAGPWLAGTSGLSVGLGGLCVPNVLAIVPVVALFLARGRTRRGAAVAIGALLVGVAVSIAPTTLRNWRVDGELVLISTNFGINLWAGNNPRATGHDVDVPGFGTSFDHREIVRQASARAGRSLSDAAVSRQFGREAMEWAGAHPGSVLVLVARKAWIFWQAREVGSNKELAGARAESRVLSALPVGFSLLAGGAALGVVFGRRGRGAPATWLLAGTALAVFASYLPFFVTARYRVPLVPVLAVLAAAALIEILRRLRAGERRAPLLALGVIAGWAMLSRIDACVRPPNLADWHLLQGVTLARGGDDLGAIQRLDAALDADPSHVRSRHERAKALARSGRSDEALADLVQAHADAPASVDVALDLGHALRRAGRTDRAVRAYRDTLAQGSATPALLSNLGLALADLGDQPAARDAWAQALALDPAFVPALVGLGSSHARAGELERAIELFERAVAAEPGNGPAQRNLARARGLAAGG
jgi:tetratricopeptide (TPR) repeat protein